jgi:hypothetical protein
MSEFDDVLKGHTTLQVEGNPVLLDRNRLAFNEANLSRFIEEEAVWYDYFGNALASSEAELQLREATWDQIYSEKFAIQKDEGASDKLAEARAKADPAVSDAKKAVIETKKVVKHLQQHLRSWDHCHANAQNRGNTLRKEMDKLGGDIRNRSGYSSELESQIDSIISPKEE